MAVVLTFIRFQEGFISDENIADSLLNIASHMYSISYIDLDHSRAVPVKLYGNCPTKLSHGA